MNLMEEIFGPDPIDPKADKVAMLFAWLAKLLFLMVAIALGVSLGLIILVRFIQWL